SVRAGAVPRAADVPGTTGAVPGIAFAVPGADHPGVSEPAHHRAAVPVDGSDPGLPDAGVPVPGDAALRGARRRDALLPVRVPAVPAADAAQEQGAAGAARGRGRGGAARRGRRGGAGHRERAQARWWDRTRADGDLVRPTAAEPAAVANAGG